MSRQELLQLLEQSVDHGRMSPQLAAYIAAELLGSEARAIDYKLPESLDAD